MAGSAHFLNFSVPTTMAVNDAMSTLGRCGGSIVAFSVAYGPRDSDGVDAWHAFVTWVSIRGTAAEVLAEFEATIGSGEASC